MSTAVVGIVMGSKSDSDAVAKAEEVFDEFEVAYETSVMSAHRSPELVRDYATAAEQRGLKVIVAAAGKAAHLGGVIASHTAIPVIGIPMKTSDLGGLDSLLSTVQMPTGIPVATVAIGGAANAALLAIAILALEDSQLRGRLLEYRKAMAESIKRENELS